MPFPQTPAGLQKKRDYNRAYRKANFDKIKAGQDKYWAAHREQRRLNQQRWRAANPDRLRVYHKLNKERQNQDYAEHPEKYLTRNKLAKQRQRDRVLDYYGAVCACCGETGRIVLTVDHIIALKVSGQKRRANLPQQVITEGFPDTYQILCRNCNWAKGTEPECTLHANHAPFLGV